MSARTQAFVNFYAAIGTLQKYVELDPKAKEIAAKQDLTVRFKVKDGPDGLIVFKAGKVAVKPFDGSPADIVLPCKDPAFFNKVVDGKATPIPVKGLFKTLKFMGKPESPFNVLTNEMSHIMRKGTYSDGREAKELSIILSFYAMVAALAQICNEDEIGKISGKSIPDGEISMAIKDVAAATLIKKDGKVTCVLEESKNPRAFMTFETLEIAGALIAGEVDAMAVLSRGQLIMKGFIPMLEQLNKALNIVPKYLS